MLFIWFFPRPFQAFEEVFQMISFHKVLPTLPVISSRSDWFFVELGKYSNWIFSYKINQNHFWCLQLCKFRYNSLFNICWYWWNPSLFVVLLYRFSKSISLNKMPAVIFYLNVHGNHILPQYQFLFSPQINFHFIQPVELLLDNGIYIWTFLEKVMW